ncbi:uncharacterized protein [Apostichopus japonicus]|uniref:uncharacterized protein n=1 Tax=Stichopus japonicus TaxID=307972 RepID=UPI003AB6AF90
MEDKKNLVNDDQLQIDEPRQYPGPQYPEPQYPEPQYPGPQNLGSTNTVITAQPVPHVPQIFRGSDALKTHIRIKVILSLMLSIFFSLFIWPLFFTIPAIVFVYLALTEIDTNIYKSRDYAKLAAILTCAAGGIYLIGLIISGVIYNNNYVVY